MKNEFVKNALGKSVPTEINGQAAIPYMGVNKYEAKGNVYAPKIKCAANYPKDGNKILPTLKSALLKAGLSNGMVISTHHHLRDGDLVANEIFKIASDLGIKDLVWFPSASFPCHEAIIEYLDNGTISRIEGSMNGALGRYCSEGKMKTTAVLRSHGGRYQAIQDGEVKIDIAVIAAPTSDPFGNANGLYGPSACGGLGYALGDYQYAENVIIVTDNIIPFPCFPMQVVGNFVDSVVVVDKIGIPEKIVSGTTNITKSPDRLLLAQMTAQFCDEAGIIKDGFSFQAGAGGTSLAIGVYFHKLLKEKKMKARFAVGGSTKYMVQMLEEGYLEYILDAQTFDLEAVRSMRDNKNHFDISIFNCYNYHSKGNYTTMMDVLILGATEIDTKFNGNVVTHSDGYLLHGIGGWQNCAFSKCTIIPIPLFRDRIPVIKDDVTTICGPGELVDVIVTERGIAINPLREDLIDKMKKSKLPIKPIEQLKEEGEKICGKPAKANLSDEVVAVVKWVDGTVIDTVKKVL
ncbi:MAG: citrate lyase subunit alpha [Bacteroidetes bacterium GWE2_29_8]|nr:MAG: citrate lyase subunit alpha [Bacteroidetes bacterium GWE2_29_8]OFY16591.1 MAG: citrate lyase subunit alpha [Bacteroidetes bacterium GWF2_29_10]